MSLPATNDFDEPLEPALYHSFPIGFPSQAWFPCTNLSCWRKSFSNSLPPTPMPQLPCLGAPLSSHHHQRCLSSGSQGTLHTVIKCFTKLIGFRIHINQSFQEHIADMADWKWTQSGFVKRASVYVSLPPSSVTLKTECLLHPSFLTYGMRTDNNTRSSSFTGWSEYQINFCMWKCLECQSL